MEEKELLAILGDAISDVGYLTWWTSNLPNVFQIEFGGTQLYFTSKDIEKKPSSQIAINFIKPKSISLISRIIKDESQTPDNWFDLLHEDKIEPLTCSYDSFTFIDDQLMQEIIMQATSIKTIYGYSPNDVLFLSERYKLVFWVGDVGLAISAEQIRFFSANGEIKIEEIKDINNQWWEYWKNYWKVRDTADALPKDYACEACIPFAE